MKEAERSNKKEWYTKADVREMGDLRRMGKKKVIEMKQDNQKKKH